MKDLISKIVCEKKIFLNHDNKKQTAYNFFFVLTNGQRVQFSPYFSNFKDEERNYDTFGDIYKFLVDEVEIVDSTIKDKKNGEK